MKAKGSAQVVHKSKAKKLLIFIPAALVALLVLAFLMVPLVVSSGPVQRFVVKKINTATGGSADMADLKMGWGKGVRVSDLTYSDKTGGLSLAVKRISTKPHYASLLGGKVSLGRTVVDEPQVRIDMRKMPEKGVSKPDRGPSTPSAEMPVHQVDLVVNDGNVQVTDRSDRTTELADINSELNLRPVGVATQLKVAMAVPAAATSAGVTAQANVNPSESKGWALEGITGKVSAQVSGLELETLGPLLALAGVKVDAKGNVSGKLDTQITDGRVENLTANATGKKVDVSSEALKGDRIQTENLSLDVKLAADRNKIDIDKLDMSTDFAVLNAAGTVPMSLNSLDSLLAADSTADIKASVRCDVAAVTAQLPQTLRIKEGMRITSGQIAGNIQTSTIGGQRKIQATAGLTDLAGIMDEKKLSLDQPVNLAAEIAASEGLTRFDKLDVTSSFARLSASGTTELLKYNAQADLSLLQAQLGQFVDFGAYHFAGSVAGNGQMSMTEESIGEVGLFTAKNLTFSAKEGTPPVTFGSDVTLGFDADYDPNLGALAVKFIEFNSELGKLETRNALIGIGEKAPPTNVTVKATNLDLAKAQPIVSQFAELPEKWTMAGIASSNLSMAKIKDGYAVKTDDAIINNLRVTSEGTEPFVQPQVKVVLDGEIYTAGGGYNLKTFTMDSPQLKLAASLSKIPAPENKTNLKGAAKADFDWAAAAPLARPFMPEGLDLYGHRATSINFASLYPAGQDKGFLRNLNARAKFGFDRASYMGLNFDAVDTDITVDRGILTLAPFSTKVNNGTASFAGKIDFNADLPVLQTPGPMQMARDVAINPETTAKLLQYVNPIFANVTLISGEANFDCEKMVIPLAKGEPNAIEVAGTLAINNINIRGTGLLGQILSISPAAARGAHLTVHPTAFTVKDSVMRYTDKMQIDFGEYPFDFTGAINVETLALGNYTVTTPYTTDFKPVRSSQAAGVKRVALPIRGTLGSPKLDTERFLQQQALGGLLDRLLK